MKKITLLLLFILTGFAHGAETRTINLCVDERNWYPFLYTTGPEREVKGIHVDIVKKALTTMGYHLTIDAYPRKQCISRVRNNEVDGMISIAFDPKIAASCVFPPGSENAKRSKWRIMQVDYMVITRRPGDYRFKGDYRTLPNPIRIPYGETVASHLPQTDFTIDYGARDDRRNILKLLRDKEGVVIATSVMAERLIKELNIPDQIRIHSIPFKSQSYYLGFSKKSGLSAEEREKIWNEIVKWRDDYVFMLQLFARY